jgi:hypothetical protein
MVIHMAKLYPQGNPLFPYFFILYPESLSIVMNKVEKEGSITGLPIAISSMVIHMAKLYPQGNPLFPYFFILYAKSLSIVMNKVEKEGSITGLPIARGGTKINHSFFANDSLLFCRASILEWMQIQDALEMYEKASG